MAVIGIAKERIGIREKRETKTERYYKRTFLVQSDNHRDDGTVIETAFGIPRIGQSYVTETSYDRTAYCFSRSCTQVTPLYWQVEAEYSSDQSKSTPGGEVDEDIPNYEWGTIVQRQVVTGQSTFDLYNGEQSQNPHEVMLLDSTGILNSAYEPYNPPAEIDKYIPTLTVSRREPLFNHRYMLYYVGGVNKYRYWGWAPRTIKVASIKGTVAYKQTGATLEKYWDVTYTFHFNISTWDLFLLDIGSYYFEGGTTVIPLKRKPGIIKGIPANVLLLENGDKSTTIARYNRFQVLHEIDLGPLMIPMVQ